MSTTIFHNPRCSKSRQTLALLEEAGVQPAIVEYLKDAPTREELEAVLQKLGITAPELLRTKEAEFKALGIPAAEITAEQALDAMVAHPKLIERPIVIKGDRAVIGRPPENALTLVD